MPWILPLALLIAFEMIADVFAKSWSVKNLPWYAVVSLLAYLIANSFWLFALKNGSGLGRGAVIFSVVSAVIAIALGFLIYKEPVTKLQLIGCLLGIASIVLLFWE